MYNNETKEILNIAQRHYSYKEEREGNLLLRNALGKAKSDIRWDNLKIASKV